MATTEGRILLAGAVALGVEALFTLPLYIWRRKVSPIKQRVVWLASTTAISLLCIVFQIGLMASATLRPPKDADAAFKRSWMLAAGAFMSSAAMAFVLPNLVRSTRLVVYSHQQRRHARFVGSGRWNVAQPRAARLLSWLEWVVLHERRCFIAFVCTVTALSLPSITMLATGADPMLQMRTMSWMMAVLDILLCLITFLLVLTVADNFGLRVELGVVAVSVTGAVALDIVTLLRGKPLASFLVEFAIFACHVLVYNATIVVPVVRSFMGPRHTLVTVGKTKSGGMEVTNRPSPGAASVAPAPVAPNAGGGTAVGHAPATRGSMPMPEELQLADVLDSASLRALLQRFLVKDFRIDLLWFRNDVVAFNGDGTVHTSAGVTITVSSPARSTRPPRQVAAECIVARYFSDNAEFSVPLPPAVRAEVLERFHASRPALPPLGLFDTALQHVTRVLETDVLPRFRHTALSLSADNDPQEDLLITRAARSVYRVTQLPAFKSFHSSQPSAAAADHASPRDVCARTGSQSVASAESQGVSRDAP